MAEIATYTRLKCDCGGELFAPLVGLKFKTGGGTVSEPAGHRCIGCGAVVDNAYMIKLVERQQKLQEIRRLQQELGTDVERPRSVAPLLQGAPKA